MIALFMMWECAMCISAAEVQQSAVQATAHLLDPLRYFAANAVELRSLRDTEIKKEGEGKGSTDCCKSPLQQQPNIHNSKGTVLYQHLFQIYFVFLKVTPISEIISNTSADFLCRTISCELSVCCMCPSTGPFAIMLRKSSELPRGDREVLLDMDNGGETQTIHGYGSLQNGVFIPPRYVSTILLYFSTLLLRVILSDHMNFENSCTLTVSPSITLPPLPHSFTPDWFQTHGSESGSFYASCDIHPSTIWYEVQHVNHSLWGD